MSDNASTAPGTNTGEVSGFVLGEDDIHNLATAIYNGGDEAEWLSTVDDSANSASWGYVARAQPTIEAIVDRAVNERVAALVEQTENLRAQLAATNAVADSMQGLADVADRLERKVNTVYAPTVQAATRRSTALIAQIATLLGVVPEFVPEGTDLDEALRARLSEAKRVALRDARQVITQYLSTAEKWRYDRVVWAFAIMLGEIAEDSPMPLSPSDHDEIARRAALEGHENS